MFTNGRSNPRALIQTSDETRRNVWLHIFGTDVLPVLHARPRWQAMQGRGFDVLAYDLALGELSDAQRQRFAGYLSRKYRTSYEMTLSELEAAVSWPIPAANVMVVEPAEQAPPLASLLSGFEQAAASLLRERRGLWARLAGV